MDLRQALKEAKTLILQKNSEKAAEILNNALNSLQTQPPDDLSQTDKLILEAEIQEGLGDTKILQQKDQEALSHLLMSMTQLETYESMTETSPDEILFRVYRKLSSSFDRLGQQFESEKYLRKAGEIKANILKTALFARFKEAGFKIKENVRAIESEASPVDIMAEKGGLFKKKRIAIWFAMDESEVDTISYLTKGYAGYVKERYILLLMGQTTIPMILGAKIIRSIDDIIF
jgi:tetratricopeptide (TPR) repeat protein